MNFLFHLYLSGADQELLVGNFMGDFVKGLLGDAYPTGIRKGLLLHRKIDSFAQREPNFQASRLRLPAHYGLYRGVLVDLFYDHFLAKGWDARGEVSLREYLRWARNVVDRHLAVIPAELQGFVPVIFDELLPSYQTVEGTKAALRRMSRRIRRANPLAEGWQELPQHYQALQGDFEKFTPAAQRFVAGYMGENLPA